MSDQKLRLDDPWYGWLSEQSSFLSDETLTHWGAALSAEKLWPLVEQFDGTWFSEHSRSRVAIDSYDADSEASVRALQELFILVQSYLIEQRCSEALESISIHKIIKENDIKESHKLLRLLLLVAVTGPSAEQHLRKMDLLDAQTRLMVTNRGYQEDVFDSPRIEGPSRALSPAYRKALTSSAIRPRNRATISDYDFPSASPPRMRPLHEQESPLRKRYDDLEAQLQEAEVRLMAQTKLAEDQKLELKRLHTLQQKQVQAGSTSGDMFENEALRAESEQMRLINEKYKRKLAAREKDIAALESRLDYMEGQVGNEKASKLATTTSEAAHESSTDSTRSPMISFKENRQSKSHDGKSHDIKFQNQSPADTSTSKQAKTALSPKANGKSRSAREEQLLEENKLISRAFYDLSTRMQQSNITVDRVYQKPQSALAQMRRKELGLSSQSRSMLPRIWTEFKPH